MSKITQRSNSADIGCLEDIEPPFGTFLSGRYKKSFAYKTIKDRLPIILTQVIDTLSRDKDNIANQYSAEALEDIKQIVGAISKLKNELVTNKPIAPLEECGDTSDYKVWNEKIAQLEEVRGETQTWYNTIWLICECYMYRRIAQEFSCTKYLKKYDPFESQKQKAYTGAVKTMSFLSEYVMTLINSNNLSPTEKEKSFINLVKMNLWGNKCDLSLSTGVVSSQEQNPLHILDSLDKDILVDNSKEVWNFLDSANQNENHNNIVDIVLDNSAYELFTDFCLAAYLTKFKFAKKVRFYVKKYPWFVSDVTKKDFHWLLESLVQEDNKDMRRFGEYCTECWKNGLWTLEEESFWTEPFDFSEMEKVNQVLYKKLSGAILIVFKGDLNYRKLMGDFNWEYTTDFQQALRGFAPSSLVSLRTIKADVVAGLPAGRAEVIKSEDPTWMETGRFGLIQTSLQSKKS